MIHRVGRLVPRLALAGVLALVVWSTAHARIAPWPEAALSARQVYGNYCAPCHGDDGKGKGNLTAPANWREIDAGDHRKLPRDFTRDWFRHGDAKADIELTIMLGSRHTAMESFSQHLTADLVSGLADIVLQFRGGLTNKVIESRFPERLPAAQPAPSGTP